MIDECVVEFCLQKRHILQLEEVLQIPALLYCDLRSGSLERKDSACSWKNWLTLVDIQILFIVLADLYLSYAWLPIKYICDTHHHKITNWNNGILNPAALQMYADAISAKGAALDNCFRFIDGTVWAFSKPGERQRVM